ncbi:DnaJ domain chaperone [Metarhizium robertsii]|uniref:DnaJ domain chaperone n=1 Tax=Metarhizium robertsii TaxID=568076 RepID=A0A0A1UWC9_9HYPO|nr:DnaJ domain chaperone [Metarhizium robertsii]
MTQLRFPPSSSRLRNSTRHAGFLDYMQTKTYAVLDLQPGVAESDIKSTYRKKSMLIHPDKTKNPQAPDAFDRLKKAQTELMDEKHRERLDEAIADARMLLIRENKWTVDSPELKTDDFAKKWREKSKEVLIDNEHRRRRQMRAQMQEEGREQRKQDAELEERKRKRQHEQDWESTRDERISSWRTFQKGKTGGDGEKKKKKKLKPIAFIVCPYAYRAIIHFSRSLHVEIRCHTSDYVTLGELD